MQSNGCECKTGSDIPFLQRACADEGAACSYAGISGSCQTTKGQEHVAYGNVDELRLRWADCYCVVSYDVWVCRKEHWYSLFGDRKWCKDTKTLTVGVDGTDYEVSWERADWEECQEDKPAEAE